MQNYKEVTGYPDSVSIACDGRLYGTWVMGQNYTVKSEYYGGYPAGYLRRIKALFPENPETLHVCSGKVDLGAFPGDTLDINPLMNPTYNVNAETMDGVPLDKYRLFLVDVPYSEEDCEHYGTAMIKRNKVMNAIAAGSRFGSYVVWLDQVLPMYRKEDWNVIAYIGMVKSTNHRFRVITIFERKPRKFNYE